MLASAVFFYGSGDDGTESPASLFDAYDLIRDSVGKREPDGVVRNEVINLLFFCPMLAAAKLFAIALLASGQV